MKLIDSLKNIVPDEQKDAALEFKAYFEKQFLGNHVLHRNAYIEKFYRYSP